MTRRSLSRLARTFPAQMEALSRHRARSAALHNLSADGGGEITRIEHVFVGPGETGAELDPRPYVVDAAQAGRA